MGNTTLWSQQFGPYLRAEAFSASWREIARRAGARESVAGTSVAGRPLLRFDLGTPGKPVVLLSALMHGIEAIGSVALLDFVQWLGDTSPDALALKSAAQFVLLPIVNPDALAQNSLRLEQGKRAWQRCNTNGVDLNRNFPRQTTRKIRHPFSGSRYRLSPHYVGPHPLSEPESRAIGRVARETRPYVSLAFHSFGNMLLYPWAHSPRENPRSGRYRELGQALQDAVVRAPYALRQAHQLYGVIGDMDDWLDAELSTFAFTVEVSQLDARLLRWKRLTNPFCWMNPTRIDETVENLTPGIVALLTRALELPESRLSPGGRAGAERARNAVHLAAT